MTKLERLTRERAALLAASHAITQQLDQPLPSIRLRSVLVKLKVFFDSEGAYRQTVHLAANGYSVDVPIDEWRQAVAFVNEYITDGGA